ncbi:MAG: hypothetical protein IJ796_02160 [Lachnospiraceae bacterium]|nr:hypothetical protein [Lachnospiraceae bacterium]
MTIDDEKDYIMRIIKEMVRMLFSLLFGRRYSAVEIENVNKFEVEGKTLDDLLDMADSGKINEAENILLDGLDYGNKENVAVAALFYQHLSEMDECFLSKNNYSKEEVLDGMKNLVHEAGYPDITNMESL